MDINGEKVLIDKLKRHLINQTIIVITHRASIIDLVDRVIVIDQGKVAAQGPKSDFMKPQTAVATQPPPPPPAAPAASAPAPTSPTSPAPSSDEPQTPEAKARRA